VLFVIGLMAAPHVLVAQEPATPSKAPPPPANSMWKADPADVSSLDAIMKAVYDVISGPQGAKRNWDRMHSLFVPGARLGPAVQLPDGQVVPRIGTLDEWMYNTYESRRAPTDPAPFARGINSFQLLYDGSRWWVVSIYWDQERPDNPIPAKYLQTVQ